MDFIKTAQEILNIKQNYVHYLDYEKLKEQHIKRVYDDDFDVYIFEQTWENTSGGFEGIGGSAMTNQTTYIIYLSLIMIVWFSLVERFAYKAPCNQNSWM